MKYVRCRVCDQYYFDDEWHKCPPTFLVWCHDYDGDIHNAVKIRAHDHEQAAEKWAEQDDSYGDYTIIGGSDATVFVARASQYDEVMEQLAQEGEIDDDDPSVPPGVEVKKFLVSGESVPQYTARELAEKEQS